jgi:transposase
MATRETSRGLVTSVHLSETCDEDLPHLIPHVATVDAPKTDVEETEAIHQALAQRDLLPSKHIVDAGYVDAELVLQSRASPRD